MLKLRITLTTILCAIAALMVSCEGDNTPAAGKEPTIELDCYELNLDGNGGDIELFYVIRNSIKGESMQIDSNVEWIKVKNVGKTAITLAVAQSNEFELRHGMLTISYKHMARPVKVYITQDKMVMDAFTFDVYDVTYNSCAVRYIPKDSNMQFMANIIDKQYFDKSGVSTEVDFIKAEMDNYLAIAKSYEMTLEELMGKISPQLIYTGEVERKFAGMQHGNQFVVYSYGITFDGDTYTQTTPIHHTIVELPMPSMYDEVSFSVSSQLSNTFVADINIKPEDWDGYYTLQIAPDDSLYYVPQGSNPESYIIKALANSFFLSARTYMQKGATAEQFLNSQCYKGDAHVTMQLPSGKRYMVIVFAVESEEGAIPVIRSVPVFSYLN